MKFAGKTQCTHQNVGESIAAGATRTIITSTAQEAICERISAEIWFECGVLFS